MKKPLAMVLLLFAPVAVHAQTATQSSNTDALSGICSGFLSESAGGVSGDHAKLCACLVRETPAQLTAAEMTAYVDATLTNQSPPQAVVAKMAAIATQCLQEAQ